MVGDYKHAFDMLQKTQHHWHQMEKDVKATERQYEDLKEYREKKIAEVEDIERAQHAQTAGIARKKSSAAAAKRKFEEEAQFFEFKFKHFRETPH